MMTEDMPRVVLRDIDIETGKQDFSELIEEHWEEVAANKDQVKLSVDWDRYEALYVNGNILAIGAYEISSCGQIVKPVGYIMDIIGPPPHYKDDVFAMNDVIYIDPAWRKTGLAARMIRASELKLKKLGVRVRTFHTKVWLNFGSLLSRLGYQHIEEVHGKVLEE